MAKQANAICIKWGTAYGPEYINRLYSGVRRNLSVPVRFFCMTEIREGLHPDIEVLDLSDELWLDEMNAVLAKLNYYFEMRKVSLFSPGLNPDLDGPLLGFDLDVAITGPLDPLLAFAPGKVIMRHDWNRAWRGFDGGHGSVFRLDPSLHGWLYETLAADPAGETERVGGEEQLYTSSVAQRHGAFSYIPPGWIASFKHDCRKNPLRTYSCNPDCRKTPASSASMADRTITRLWRGTARPGRPCGEGTCPAPGRESTGSTGPRRIWAPTGPLSGAESEGSTHRSRGHEPRCLRAERE